MLIVEGADHTGKSTFCKKLSNEMTRQGVPSRVQHMSKPDDSFDYFGDYLKELRSGIVYDRFHYGAYVYGAMLRLHPTVGFSLTTMQLVSRFIHLRGGMIIVLHDSSENGYIRRLTDESKEEMFNVNQILMANTIFRHINLVDKPDYTFDVSGGWPPQAYAEMLVSDWRHRNGL